MKIVTLNLLVEDEDAETVANHLANYARVNSALHSLVVVKDFGTFIKPAVGNESLLQN